MALSAALIAGLGSCDFLEQTENTYQTIDYQFSCFENVKKVCSHVYSYLDVDTEWLICQSLAFADLFPDGFRAEVD